MKITTRTTVPSRTERLARRLARALVRAHVTCPICVLPGDAAPRLRGEKYHYTNLAGHLVRYPNAYRRAFGRPIYVPSTRRVEVGEHWLREAARAARFLPGVR